MLDIACRAATAAAVVVRDHVGRSVVYKGAVDLVTEVDVAAEEAIRKVLDAATPGVAILAEESGGAWQADSRWVVDPIDGTTNFVHGFPYYCVSIAFQDRGTVTCGVVYDLVRDQLYRAELGQGAWLGDRRLAVSSCPDLDRALVASGFAYDRRQKAACYLRFVQRMLERSQGFRRTGSAAMDLCLVASGLLDGYWEFNLKPWDVAAGALLVTEAGGIISDVDGSSLDLDHPRVIASTPKIHREMVAAFADLMGDAPG
jgi:myo-inositol-1(or 4)-monophosphatase